MTTPTLSLKLFFTRAEDRVNLIILTVALFIVSKTMQCIALLCNVFICGETKILRSFCQQEVKRLP